MKKLISICFILLWFTSIAYGGPGYVIVGGSVPVAVGPTCSGDWSSGQNETFEKGAGQWCTTDWSETDTGTNVNEYNSSWYFCGTHSLSVGTTNGNFSSADFGATDDDFYLRFYFKGIDLDDYSNGIIVRAAEQDVSSYRNGLAVYYRDHGGGGVDDNVQICGNSTTICSTNYHEVGPNAELRIEVHYVRNGTTTMKVWKKNGASWDAVNHDGAGAESSVTSINYGMRYIGFGWIESTTYNSGASTIYFDDIQYDSAGAGYIGAETCD